MKKGVVGALALLVVAGCSSDASGQEATAAAVDFVTAAPEEACGRLAPATREALEQETEVPCAEALADLSLPTDPSVSRVEVAIESAQVQLTDQVIFLARFPDGWLVTAAGCERTDSDDAIPYDCEVES